MPHHNLEADTLIINETNSVMQKVQQSTDRINDIVSHPPTTIHGRGTIFDRRRPVIKSSASIVIYFTVAILCVFVMLLTSSYLFYTTDTIHTMRIDALEHRVDMLERMLLKEHPELLQSLKK